MKRPLYIIGGVFNLLFAAFHIMFYFRPLPPDSQGNMAILNNSMIVLFVGIAGLSFFFVKELPSTRVGRAVSIFVAAFFLIRAVEEVIYYGVAVGEIVIVVLCMVVSSLYLIPLFIGEKQPVRSPA